MQSNGESNSDRDLLERARSGDDAAFRLLVLRHEGAVAAAVIGILGPGDEADDVGQETFIRFYRAMGSFRGDSSLRTYLTRIAVNLSLNAARRRSRWFGRHVSRDDREQLMAEPAGDARDDVEASERERLVSEAIGRLSDQHRAIVTLRMIEGYSTQETADMLGIPEGTVMSRLYRALGRLEADLRPLVEDH